MRQTELARGRLKDLLIGADEGVASFAAQQKAAAGMIDCERMAAPPADRKVPFEIRTPDGVWRRAIRPSFAIRLTAPPTYQALSAQDGAEGLAAGQGRVCSRPRRIANSFLTAASADAAAEFSQCALTNSPLKPPTDETWAAPGEVPSDKLHAFVHGGPSHPMACLNR
jgi:hypothetical protein